MMKQTDPNSFVNLKDF